MKHSKILVTGSAGFIGSHLVDHLASLGHSVFGVDDLSGGFLYNVTDKKHFTKLDLRDRVATSRFVRRLKPDIVFHLAADATEGRSQFTPLSAIDRNLGAYMNVLVPAIRCGVKKVILTSSMSVYGKQRVPFKESMQPKPEDIYGIAKTAMEQATRVMSEVYGFSFVIIRPHNVYGPRQNLTDPYRNVIGIFINRLMQGKPYYIYGDGGQTRAFSYIDDVVPAMAKAAFSRSAEGEVFNIGADIPYTIRELSDVILRVFSPLGKIPKTLTPTYLPFRPQEVKDAYSSHAKAKKLLGYIPRTSLQEGIARMVSWARQLGPQQFTYLKDLELSHRDVPVTWSKKLM
jgi:UDP-glucose 4-epimerase